MQIERLHERVAVRADFRGGVITPVAVARKSGERFVVEGVSGRWVSRPRSASTRGRPPSEGAADGGEERSGRAGHPCYHFTVKMRGAMYELVFDADVPEWWLERVMVE